MNAWRSVPAIDSKEQMRNFGRGERLPSIWSPLELWVGPLITEGRRERRREGEKERIERILGPLR